MANSTIVPKQQKLSYHKQTRYWYKTKNGKRFYLFRVDDDAKGEKSLAEWLRIQDDPEAKRTTVEGLSLHELANRFMAFKDSRCKSGELSNVMFAEYKETCQMMLAILGKETVVASISSSKLSSLRDYFSERYNVNGVGKRVTQTRSVFKFAFDEGLIESPIRFGQTFTKPSAKSVRIHKQEKGRMDFTRAEILSLLKTATPTRKAMILLGINCALGNTDVSDIEPSNINLKAGWLIYPRQKTATPRKCPLWPESIEAIKKAISKRPMRGRVFMTSKGTDYTEEKRQGGRVAKEFYRACDKAKVERNGRGFYSLRRTFQTQAENCRDLPAIRLIMGHTDASNDMPARYRQHIDDERLLAASNAVREWLFGTKAKSAKRGAK